jgi:CubicO group peptidase (beta-lactamase class C family)
MNQEELPMLYEKELDSVLQEIMTRWDIPGLAVGLVRGDDVVYAKGFGVQSLETRAPVTLDSVFCTASVSKCFVATAVMQLVERGKIDLDAPLVQYLPYFQMDDERHRQITIRQILSHTSGMPDMEEDEYVDFLSHPEYDDGAAERYVRGLKNRKLIAEPGEKFSYSNIAYNVLGDMLAKISGKSFEEAMREHILLPSGMPNSTFMLADVPQNLLAVPHLRSPEMKVNPDYPYHRADAPASFLHSTVVDMCHWGVACLNQSILSPASYDLMWTPVADRGYSRPSMYEEVGLGWTLGHYKDARTISHGGMGFGWSDFFLILPEQNCAAVLLCNEESFSRTRIIRALADALLDQKPQANAVSWMVPICRALAEGGIDAAYARCAEIKAKNDDEFYFDEDELIGLALQLFSAKKIDLAIDVLGLNIHVYPEYVEAYIQQAKFHLIKGESAQAEKCLLQAQAIQPDDPMIAGMLAKAHK